MSRDPGIGFLAMGPFEPAPFLGSARESRKPGAKNRVPHF